jgi:hypothetical protein
MAGHWWWGVDLAPGAGMSTLERGRGTRAVSFGIAGTLSTAVRGIDFAGGLAVTRKAMCGAQIAGGAALVLGTVHGVQLAGGVNFAGGVHGAQISTVNIAHGDVRGVQVGVVNVSTGDVRGFQLGVVNVAKDGDAALGVVSIYRHGRTNLDVTATDPTNAMVSLEHGGRLLHNIYGFGERKGGDTTRAFLAVGLGARVVGTEDFSFDIDLLHHWIIRTDDAYTSLEQLRLLFGVKLASAFTIIAGPTYSVLVTKDPAETAGSTLPSSEFTHEGSATRVIGWPGITFGVRLL